jgi:hypothetical protein
MAKEIRFTDPAFRCEVVLSGTILALYEASQPHFDRLKDIKSLGVLAHVHDVAMHTRHQHSIGLMRIFNKLCQQPKDKGLPKKFLWSFWGRLCFGQTGHAALSYDSEKAVLLACNLNSAFKNKIKTLFQPVIAKIAACQICEKNCQAKSASTVEATDWLEQDIKNNRWNKLYLWMAALKLINEPGIQAILRGQALSPTNQLGYSEAEMFKMLIAPNCQWIIPIRRLNRLDFIIRDLAFAGTFGIQMDVDNLVGSANTEHHDWNLLVSLSKYMSDTLYESKQAQTLSVLYQRALAALFIKNKLSVDELFGIHVGQYLSDDRLVNNVKRTSLGQAVFDKAQRQSWQSWEISTFVDNKLSPFEIEQKITGQKKGFLLSHNSKRATCFKMRKKDTLAIAISHQDINNRPRAKTFLKLCRSLLNQQYPLLNLSIFPTSL